MNSSLLSKQISYKKLNNHFIRYFSTSIIMQNNKGEVIDISKVHIRLRSGIKTPCVDICKMDPSNGQCFGCSRKRDEIANWGRMTDEQRDQVIEDLPNRKM